MKLVFFVLLVSYNNGRSIIYSFLKEEKHSIKNKLTVCEMNNFPVELTASSKSAFSLLAQSSLSWGGKRQKQTNENFLGATTCTGQL